MKQLRTWCGPILAVLAVAAAGIWHSFDTAAGAAGAGAPWLNSHYRLLFAAVLAALLVSGWLLHRCRENKFKWERLAPLLVLMFGSMYALVLAPLSAPDEIAHFMNSYQMSSRLLLREAADEQGYILIRQADDFIQNIGGASGDQERISIGRILEEETYELLREQNRGVFISETGRQMIRSVYRPIETTPAAHVVPAVGIALARLAGVNGVILLYLGRFCNLIFFAGTLYLVMKLIPFGQPVLMGVALLPMTLHQAASYSYDAFVMSLYFLFGAYCLRLAFVEPQVRKRDVAVLMVVIAALGPCKIVYASVMGFALLIPLKKFGDKKRWCLAALAVLASFGAAMVLVNGGVIMEIFAPGTAVSPAVPGEAGKIIAWAGEPGYELSDLIYHPDHLVRLIYESVVQLSDEWFLGLLGFQLGNLDPVLSVPFAILFAMALCLAALSVRKAGEALYLSGGQKAWIVFLAAVSLLGMMAAMLLSWTPVSSKVIEGVQGRYLLPALPFLLMTVKNDRLVRTAGNDERLIFYLCAMEGYVLLRLFSIVSMRL